ncbi:MULTISPECIES: hypothetical protein [Flavobacterium]|uniref:hypothetical protein n=1 Tax=Flavobacterium TaxID=237 RepID=UPI001FCC6739|nr:MULTISPECIES: hypothetical protein [Flavobacterium]UOK41427.1 hypothetical protein LZF87_08850 [Flavobacterium enshiense]
MGLFDNKELTSRIKDVEKNQQKLAHSHSQFTNAISSIKKELGEVTKRSPEYEKEAQQASKKTSEFKNRAFETLEEVREIQGNVSESQLSINSAKDNILTKHNEIKQLFDKFNTERDEFNETMSTLLERIGNVNQNISLLEETIENHPDFEEEISELETYISKIKENESKSSQLIKSITNRKIELETLYNEILGFNSENEETGEEVLVKGLKQELEESLDGLEERTEELKLNFNKLETNTNENVNNLLKSNSEKINTQINEWEDKYNKLNEKIESLLPNALTAGLSSAFSKKKDEEVKAYDNHKTQFSIGIGSMIAVSLIPFAISVFTLMNDTNFDIIINRAPKIVIAILPLYIPVLWLSISSNKKMNLSKRLIEEYSHKEVLSKTFEGLSKQIQNLGEDSISNELKIKLLQDFLQMYSENPGKLISDYNTSDHPIMELLENSNKLERTISKLEKIPGLQKVADILEKKSEKKLEQATNVIERNLDRIVGLNDTNNDDEIESA